MECGAVNRRWREFHVFRSHRAEHKLFQGMRTLCQAGRKPTRLKLEAESNTRIMGLGFDIAVTE